MQFVLRNVALSATVEDSQVKTMETSMIPVVQTQVRGGEIQTEISFSALAAASKSPKSQGNWLLDSCCSRHMTGNQGLFLHLSSVAGDIFVKFGDGKRLKAQGIGQVTTPLGQLEALYVPHLCANLLSVSQLNKAGASVSFHSAKSEILYAGQRFPVTLVGNIFQVDEICCFHSESLDDLDLWHQRLGHLNFPATITFLKRFGMEKKVDKSRSNLFCSICAQAKLNEKRFSSRRQVMDRVLGRVHSDIGGPIDKSHQGYTLWITFLDETSRFAEVRCLKFKSEAPSTTQNVLTMLAAKQGCGVAILRTDGGSEYQSLELQKYLKDNGIEHEKTPPYTPELNGMAERLNRTLIERVRCLLISSGLNNSFWKEAMDYSVYIYNNTPHSGLAFRTPSEVFNRFSLIKLPRFYVFGSECYYHIPKEHRTKLDMNGQKGLFLGFTNTASIVLDLNDLSLHEVRTIQVIDAKFYDQEALRQLGIGRTIHYADVLPIAAGIVKGSGTLHVNDQARNNVNAEIEGDHVNENAETEGDFEFQDQQEPMDIDPPTPEQPLSEMEGEENQQVEFGNYLGQRNSGRETTKRISYAEEDAEWHPSFGRRRHTDDNDEIWQEESSSEDESYIVELMERFYICKLASQEDDLESAKVATVQSMLSHDTHNSSESSTQVEPRSFKQAYNDSRWKKSMQEEYDSLMNNKTWTLVDLPKGRKIVKNKWVYKLKSDGRFKSRLVAKGFTQVAGVDFDETWSPVGRKARLKLLIWFVLNNNWSWKQMDVDTAFLNSKLEEEIYMQQPEGYDDGTSRVCQLLKSIYGLKQASRAWYDTLREFLESVGLQRSRVDPCIYFGHDLILFVYVDDMIIAGASNEIVEDMSNKFKKRFKMKDLGTPRRIIGLDLVQTSQGILLSGVSMIEELLRNYEMSGSRHVSTPMDHNQSFLPNAESKADEELQTKYASIMGSLLYIANSFRPDLSYAVSVLSQFTGNPSEDHLKGIKRVLRYLNGTRAFGLLIRKDDDELPMLKGFTDADFAACYSRKSRTGYAFFVGSSILSWSSRKQSVIALSTCEAEYYALTEGGKEAMHLKKLFWEVNNQKPLPDDQPVQSVKLFCDNQSTIFVSKNPAEHKMMKHVDLRHKWIQEKVENKEFEVEYVPTKDQTADIFTKALPRETFERLRSQCGMMNGIRLCSLRGSVEDRSGDKQQV